MSGEKEGYGIEEEGIKNQKRKPGPGQGSPGLLVIVYRKAKEKLHEKVT